MTARTTNPDPADLSAGRKAARTRRAWVREPANDLPSENRAVLRLARRAASTALGRAQRDGIIFDADFNRNLRAQLEGRDLRGGLFEKPTAVL